MNIKAIIAIFLLLPLAASAKSDLLPPPDKQAKPLSDKRQLENRYYFNAGKRSQLVYGDMASAVEYFRRAAEADSRCDVAYYEMSKIYAAASDFDHAIPYAEYAYQLDTANVWYVMLLAELYANVNEFTKAQTLLNGVLAKDPKNLDALQILLNIYEQTRLYDKAVRLLSDYQKKYGNTEATMRAKQAFLVKQGRMMDAINETKRLIERFPDDQRNYLALADLYGVLRVDSLSYATLMRAKGLDSSSFDYLMALADFYRRTSNYNGYFAIQNAIFAIPSAPLLYKLQSLDFLVRTPEAQVDFMPRIDTLFQIADTSGQRSYRLNLLYARYLFFTKRPDKSFRVLQQMVWSAQSDARMRSLARQKQNSPYFLAFAPEMVALHDGWQLYFDMLMAKNQWDTLMCAADTFANFFDDKSQSFYLHGLAHLQKKEYEQAKVALLAATEFLVPEDTLFSVRLYSMLGDAYFYLNEYSKSDKYFKKAIKLQPDNMLTLNNYAYYLSLADRKLKYALTMSKRTIEAEPDNATYLDTYAWILYRLGRYAESRQIFRQALVKGGDKEPVMLEHYGDVLYKLNDRSTAKIYWQRALENGADSPELRQKLNQEN